MPCCRGINDWQLPPETTWPAGTVQAGDKAVQTPFRGGESVALTFAEVWWGILASNRMSN